MEHIRNYGKKKKKKRSEPVHAYIKGFWNDNKTFNQPLVVY